MVQECHQVWVIQRELSCEGQVSLTLETGSTQRSISVVFFCSFSLRPWWKLNVVFSQLHFSSSSNSFFLLFCIIGFRCFSGGEGGGTQQSCSSCVPPAGVLGAQRCMLARRRDANVASDLWFPALPVDTAVPPHTAQAWLPSLVRPVSLGLTELSWV